MDCLKKNKIKHILLVFACVVATMLVCAGCTSPLYPHYACLDSSIFLTIGKGLAEGKICYVDLFDHKGPVFFWLEALGYVLGKRTGVWLLQCILATVDILIVEEICKLLQAKAILPVISSAAVFFYTFLHGNLTEEYSLPFLLAALYFELKFLGSDEKSHNPWWAFLYGVLFALLAFIRVNNAVSICFLILCIAVVLIREKQWKNLFFNIVAGVAGIAVITGLVCFYYWKQGALNDMIYATFLHNLIYAKESSHAAIFSTQFPLFALLYAPGIFAAVVFFQKARKEKGKLYWSLFATTIVTYLMLVYSNIYAHYFTLGIPMFAIAVACAFPAFEIKKTIAQIKEKKILGISLAVIVVAYAALSAYSAAAPFYKTYVTGSANAQYEQVQEGVEVIPEEERNSVVGFEMLADFYVHSGITPCYKYYTLQHWWSTSHTDVYGEFVQYVKTEHPLWIVTKPTMDDKGMKDILSAQYELKEKNDFACFYRYIGG